jgi:AcrR family transcriptional regulator
MTTHPARPRRSQAQRSAETRLRLLDATINCLVRYGYAGTTTPRVAEMAGLTRGAQVHHFGSKDELMLAAVEHLAAKRTADSLPRFGEGLSTAPDPIGVILDIAWDLYGDEWFVPCVELWVAGRTDPELGREVARFEVIVGVNLGAAVAEFVPVHIRKPMMEFIYTAMDALRGILITAFVDPDPGRAKRRWERAGDRLRLTVDPSINAWIAARSYD